MSHAHEVNAFGALAVEVADRVQKAGNPHGASVPAALAALHGLAAGQSIDSLARVVGLSHSGAVRLVDRLSETGFAERRMGADGRAVALQLTPEGRRAARRVLAQREAAIERRCLRARLPGEQANRRLEGYTAIVARSIRAATTSDQPSPIERTRSALARWS